MNVLSHSKQQEIAILYQSGKYSNREIARLTGIHRDSVNRYVKRLVAEMQNQPRPSTDLPKTSHPCPPTSEPSACEAYAEWIGEQVKLGRSATGIYQELVYLKSFQHKYATVKRFVRKLRHVDPLIYDILSFAPGEEAQVDYGQGAMTLDPVTGKYRRPRLFVMTLRYFRKSFRKVVWKSGADVWAKLHEEAFQYFGGSVQFVVLDNLKEGVVKPNMYDPELNAVYAACLSHYGAIADPCRVRDPDRKGTVESGIKHTQETALKGKKFESIEEQNAYLAQWEETWAGTRIHGTVKRQVNAMFLEEKPHLKALPIECFRFFKEEIRTVDDAATVTIDKVRYSARPALPFAKVSVRIYENEVEIYSLPTHEILRRHRRSYRPGTVVIEEKDRIFNPSRNTEYGIKQASEVRPNTLKFCDELFRIGGRIANKQIFGVTSLARKYGNSIVENAAETCIERDRITYAELKRVSRNLAQIDATDREQRPNLIQESELIKNMDEYVCLWDHHTEIMQ